MLRRRNDPSARGPSRREVLRGAGALGLGMTLGGWDLAAAAGHRRRKPGVLPHPHLPEGTDALPAIEHIIVLMMENHSFDNYLGVLGRGDGFRLRHGVPTASNPDDAGTPIAAFHMPST